MVFLKKSSIRFFSLCFAVLLLLTIPINALTQASDYIQSYSINVSTSGQKVQTVFKVRATGEMTKLGTYSIRIYEYPYNSSNLVDSKDEFDTGMTKTNSFTYSNSITYTGQSGKNYKVIVTVFARDASGSDSRTETYYVST